MLAPVRSASNNFNKSSSPLVSWCGCQIPYFWMLQLFYKKKRGRKNNNSKEAGQCRAEDCLPPFDLSRFFVERGSRHGFPSSVQQPSLVVQPFSKPSVIRHHCSLALQISFRRSDTKVWGPYERQRRKVAVARASSFPPLPLPLL